MERRDVIKVFIWSLWVLWFFAAYHVSITSPVIKIHYHNVTVEGADAYHLVDGKLIIIADGGVYELSLPTAYVVHEGLVVVLALIGALWLVVGAMLFVTKVD